MELVLDIQHLSKKYGKKTALEDISFSVKAGTCFGLLGPNGAGKSTTMKILTGIVDADNGNVMILGMDSKKHLHSIKQKVGYVPQSITLYEELNAYDNLLFFGQMYGVKGKLLQERITKVLTQTGLLDRAKDKVKEYSGGMKRRINIAAALLHDPKILILDEPTVGIDPQSRNHIFDMIRALKEEGVTIIYSTHYMEEVEVLCDDIAIIDNGKIITQGNLKELLEQYSTKSIYIETDDIEKLKQLIHISKITSKNDGWVIESDQPVDLLQTILKTTTEQGIKIQALEMMRPTLESVFLSLTGTSLRDK
ncbi:ABC transporter ATP-binding protein [Paenisporosarcina antarctica]|uniref:ABC transporter ATP-binding protein n=1 Tax=Paenisporosarcina antarctica TaxID=417367 RepID=A0A4V1AN86_9BACL|nr:ABC transporter ATP-binding protein [Paenisporosarcina antarctica]QBP41905.1 ABC transporter ATP-binding protein [Paenisporosarcina antarctica]